MEGLRMKSKLTHLVCQHLENISREALEKYPEIIRDFVRRRHGIYALFRKNHLYYVGLATNLRSRLSHHLRDRHAETWDRFSVYLTIGDQHLREIESLLLRIASPKGNRVAGKFVRSENVKPAFSREIKKAQKREWAAIMEPEARVKPSKREEAPSKEGRTPTLARYIKKRLHIRMDYKGKRYIAHVRKGGSITFAAEGAEAGRLQSKVFTSPSLAAAAAANRRTMNGWTWWKYERAPGDWVLIDELRK
jgi:hypothetical protein